jgi:asparagine synthase (glutamine-hydrolysing)
VELDGWAGLGHVRLSITDVARGQQPISNEDGSVTAIVNGEFYDHQRIRDELRARGHTFRTESDSEILVHLWEELGPGCLAELRGEFAFVLVCRTSRRMFAARDRFGIKPLFLARPQGELVLASEIKGLFAAGVTAAWDPGRVFDGLHGCRHEGKPSVFEGVEEVPPGHYLLHDSAAGTDQMHRYWRADYPSRSLGERLGWKAGPCADEAATTERVRGMLEESVALRADCELPVACYLSGGVDSAAVLGMASRLSGRSIDAFTVRFDHPDFDESAAAREMAAHVGSR